MVLVIAFGTHLGITKAFVLSKYYTHYLIRAFYCPYTEIGLKVPRNNYRQMLVRLNGVFDVNLTDSAESLVEFTKMELNLPINNRSN